MRVITTSIAILCVACAFGQISVQAASNNSTIKPTGPRAGTSNGTFFNVEGSTNAANASFGVLDWTASSFGFGTVASVNSVSVALTEANAAFTLPGTLHFYFAPNTAASINNDGTSTLTWALDANHNANGVDNQLGSLIDLGTGFFSTTGNVNNGTVDAYTLTLSATAKSYVTTALNTAGGTIRLVIAGEESVSPSVAATWAGYTNTTPNPLTGASQKPTLTINANPVPEPASIAAVSLGILGIVRRRRLKKS